MLKDLICFSDDLLCAAGKALLYQSENRVHLFGREEESAPLLSGNNSRVSGKIGNQPAERGIGPLGCFLSTAVDEFAACHPSDAIAQLEPFFEHHSIPS